MQTMEQELEKVIIQREKAQAHVASLVDRERNLRVRLKAVANMTEPKTLEEEKAARRLAAQDRIERVQAGEANARKRLVVEAIKNSHPPQGRPRSDEQLLKTNDQCEFDGAVYKVQGLRLHKTRAGVETWYYKLRDAELQKSPIFVPADEVTEIYA